VIQVPPPPTSPIDDRDLRSKVERAQIIEDRPLEGLPAIPSTVAPLEPAREAPGAPVEPAETPEPVRPAVRETAARPAPAREKAPAVEARPAFHVVKRGETLFAIAERYGLEVKDLRKWNKLRKHGIQVGQRLRLKR